MGGGEWSWGGCGVGAGVGGWLANTLKSSPPWSPRYGSKKPCLDRYSNRMMINTLQKSCLTKYSSEHLILRKPTQISLAVTQSSIHLMWWKCLVHVTQKCLRETRPKRFWFDSDSVIQLAARWPRCMSRQNQRKLQLSPLRLNQRASLNSLLGCQSVIQHGSGGAQNELLVWLK